MRILMGYTYLLTNKTNRVFYVGVTEDLIRRVYQHKTNAVPGFTAKYQVHKLVWYEQHESIVEAIKREKQLKGGSRKKKIELIQLTNPLWRDLYDEIASSF